MTARRAECSFHTFEILNFITSQSSIINAPKPLEIENSDDDIQMIASPVPKTISRTVQVLVATSTLPYTLCLIPPICSPGRQ